MLDPFSQSGLSSENRATLIKLQKLKAQAKLKLLDLREGEAAPQVTNEITTQEIAFTKANPYRDFINDGWGIVEPGNPYVSGWHIDAIAEHLEACSRGELKNLVINIPPRFMKSMLICVFWFCWTWTFRPYTRWIYSSYTESFALRDSNKCRRIIKSKWYQHNYGDKFQISKEQDQKTRFENDKAGFRLATGVRGKGTGEGADFIICDDPHKVLEAESKKVVDATIEWWHKTMYNRFVDPKTTVRIIVMQRISEGDLTGDILAKELDYEHLCLPMTFESEHPHANLPEYAVKRIKSNFKVTAKPTTLGKVNEFDVNNNPNLKLGEIKKWIDPRLKDSDAFQNVWFQEWKRKYYAKKSEGDGELLFPQRIGQKEVDDLAKSLEVYGEAGQLQQRPSPKGGNFFLVKNLKPISRPNIPLNDYYILRYWDKAGTEGGGDWTVGVLMARSKDLPYQIIILNVVRVREAYQNRMETIKETTKDDYIYWAQNGGLDCDYTVVLEKEGGSAGTDLASIEIDHLAGYSVRADRPTGSKTARARTFKTALDNNRVYILEDEGNWQKDFKAELEKFIPDKDNQVDDQVDAASGAYRQLVFMAGRVRPTSGGGSMRASRR